MSNPLLYMYTWYIYLCIVSLTTVEPGWFRVPVLASLSGLCTARSGLTHLSQPVGCSLSVLPGASVLDRVSKPVVQLLVRATQRGNHPLATSPTVAPTTTTASLFLLYD